ncbi:hypothetical protein VZT92_002435 [Zoarces viviparus]|uniref:C-type lectin domain-containing protein n=1 Tax=Zoarces viviparus TaxID=48416 RepID=A0AAW1FZD7_ZOAVI
MQQMEVADYANERPRRGRSEGTNKTERRRLCHLLFLGFGVLFIIQVILSVSLRFTLYSSKECNATDVSDRNQVKEVQTDYEEKRPGHCNGLEETIKALTGDKNLLENRYNELTSVMQTVQEENNRLKMNLSEPSKCVSSQPCPADWREINSRCYFLSTEKKTWEHSRKYCQSKDADLVVISSRQELRTLYRLDGDADLLFWIGLSDITGTTGWKWVDGSALTEPFWQSGQPDRSPTKVEDCVEMYHFNPAMASWVDVPCGVERRWLCEKDPCPLLERA